LQDFYRKNVITLFVFLPLVYFGCTSVGTVRYQKDNVDIDTSNSTIRFTSADDSLIVDLNLDLKDPGDLPDEEQDIQISSLLENYNSNHTYDIPGFDYTTLREKMLMEIIKYLGTPYKYGGNNVDGIDCSAFTQNIYKSVLGIELERSARLQFNQGAEISEMNELKFGDLVFFNTRKRVKPGHVGIFIGENLFAHASSKKGVTISSLDHSYYSKRYMGARRFDNEALQTSQ
jgi:cell wall-associated NlpC family hydrolase